MCCRFASLGDNANISCIIQLTVLNGQRIHIIDTLDHVFVTGLDWFTLDLPCDWLVWFRQLARKGGIFGLFYFLIGQFFGELKGQFCE